jgi:N-acetylglutamate synthase
VAVALFQACHHGEVDRGGLQARADLNLTTTWREMGAAAGGTSGGGVDCPFLASGVPVAPFNAVFALSPVADPDECIETAQHFMAEIGVPFFLWIGPGVNEPLAEAARAAGFTDAGGPPAMLMTPLNPVPGAPDDLRIDRVDDPERLDEFRFVMSAGFGLPLEVVEQLVPEAALHGSGLAYFLGSVAGGPVACSTVSVADGTAGIYNVASVETSRGRGFGTALTWAAVGHGADMGCDLAILQSSQMGASVYSSMGFAEIGRYLQLVSPAS